MPSIARPCDMRSACLHLPLLILTILTVFAAPARALYVRVTLAPQAGKAIGLWEIELYDRAARTEGGERIQLPTPANR